MPQLKHILFPVDFSEGCRSFAPTVRAVACRTAARLTMLNVLELPSGYYSNPYAILTFKDIVSSMRRERAEFRKFLAPEFAPLPGVRRISKHGDVAGIITDFARRNEADLIMMPTHGVGPFRRFLIGSVTAKVLHDATCPVWTSAHVPEERDPEQIRKILCAVDFGARSVEVMQYASWLAKTFGAELRFVNVVAVSESWTVRCFEADFIDSLIAEAREQLTKIQSQAATPGDSLIRSGDIAHSVRREALEWGADAIVIGRGVITETLGRLRTESYHIIRESPCSVVSV